MKNDTSAELQARVRELEHELTECRDTLDALRRGDFDAVVVGDKTGERHIYTLETADRPYRFLIEQMQEGAVTLSTRGTILFCNRRGAEILSVAPERIIGQQLDNFLVPEDAPRFSALLAEAANSSARGEVSFRRRDLDPISVQFSASALSVGGSKMIGGVLTDLMEQKSHLRKAAELANDLAQARDRAEQASRAKSRFLAGISHELRTPLNGILGCTRLLRMEGALSPLQNSRLDAMQDAGKHLLEMISCVLDLSEIETEHFILKPVELDVHAIVIACLDLVRPMAEAKGLSLSVSTAAGTSCKLVADPTRLRQILLNILGNATKFTSQGSVQVRLLSADNGSALRIEVADTGPGISAEGRKRLFQDFERQDADVTRAAEGAGLGLSIASRLARMMGGSLGVDESDGVGCVFWLRLPLLTHAADPDATTIPHVTPVEPATKLAPKLNLLVVDDVAINRDIAQAFLLAAGHSVVCVDGGAEAVAAAADTIFDVILMDIRMPGMDGLEATRRIRALKIPHSGVPIMALTAQAFTEQIAECYRAGMNAHLAKPFEPETLLAAVMKAVTPESEPDAVTPGGKADADVPSVPAIAPQPDVAAVTIAPTQPVIYVAPVTLSEDADTAQLVSPGVVGSVHRAVTTLASKLWRRLRGVSV